MMKPILPRAACICQGSLLRKISFVLLLWTISIASAFAQSVPLVTHSPFKDGEMINYNIYYNWGFIWKKAAEGKLRVVDATYEGQSAFKLELSCKTMSFVDRIMRVRDTLVAYTTPRVKPLYYAKLTHEGDYEASDLLTYRYIDGKTAGDVTLIRRNKAPIRDTIWSDEQAFDMLSVFYFMRTLDFPRLQLNHVVNLPIFTGRRLITMQVIYVGEGPVTLHNKKTFDALKLHLQFINDENLKEEDPPIEVWLSNDDRKIPIKMAGKLPIGSLQAEYSGD